MYIPAAIKKIGGMYLGTISHPAGRFQCACEGKTKQEVIDQLDALVAVLVKQAIRDGESVPAPDTFSKGSHKVYVHGMVAIKATLFSEMKRKGIKKIDLARLMGKDARQIDRLFDPSHKSVYAELDRAAQCLGKRLEVALV